MNDPSATEFDEVYYEKLMDGLETVEIDLSVCKNIIDFRIDASTYKKDYVQTDEILKSLNACSIGDKMNSIQNFGAYSLCNDIEFTDYGIPFLITQNVRHNYIDWNNIRYISEASHKMLHKSHCRKGQVLVTMAGEYLGRVAVYDRDFICSSNQAIAKITLKDNVSPYYVATFLNSRYGQNQINRFRTVTGQPNINMALIKSLKIPFFSDEFSKVIENIVMYSNEMFRRANNFYQEAEKLLIETLGLANFHSDADRYSIKPFKSSYGNTGRLDAEFYQQKYDEYEHAVLTYNGGCVRISDRFQSIKTKCLRNLNEYHYVEIGDINIGNGSSAFNVVATENLPDNAKIMTRKGDVIVSTVRPNRGAVSILEEDNLLVSGAFTVLRQNSNYPKEILQILLRTEIYRDWLLKYNVGTSYPVIKDDDVLNMPIPLFTAKTEEKVIQMVKESQKSRRHFEQLLDYAKRAVEMAIEQGENVAITICKQEGVING